MKAVILAGGLGSRLSEMTDLTPKPMLEIGENPIIWHIMRNYSHHGIDDFIVCLGYKGDVIKEYFLNYFQHNSDVTVDLGKNTVEFHRQPELNWRVTLVDTDLNTQTGGRLKRIGSYLDDEPFCMTYGDAVADLDISAVIAQHERCGTLATVTAVRPIGRFGAITTSGDTVIEFKEKPVAEGGWINGGFFVLSPKVLDFIDGDDTIWERRPLIEITKLGQLSVYRHDGFWQCMDTLRDKRLLDELWETPNPPWRMWDQRA
jgi:glucose-1-phosphate cytidylyltransferase